jgi:hypothetical protein
MQDSLHADFCEMTKFKSAVLRVFTIHNTFWMDSRFLDTGNNSGGVSCKHDPQHPMQFRFVPSQSGKP